MKRLYVITCILAFLYCNLVFAEENNDDLIPFDKSPPALVKLFERNAKEAIENGKHAKELIDLIGKIEKFAKKHPFILLHLGGEGSHPIVFQTIKGKEQLANDKEKILLKEYRELVEIFHDKTIGYATLHDLDIAFKSLKKFDNEDRKNIETSVLARYPKYENFHKDAIALFFVLVDPTLAKELEKN